MWKISGSKAQNHLPSTFTYQLTITSNISLIKEGISLCVRNFKRGGCVAADRRDSELINTVEGGRRLTLGGRLAQSVVNKPYNRRVVCSVPLTWTYLFLFNKLTMNRLFHMLTVKCLQECVGPGNWSTSISLWTLLSISQHLQERKVLRFSFRGTQPPVSWGFVKPQTLLNVFQNFKVKALRSTWKKSSAAQTLPRSYFVAQSLKRKWSCE